MKVLTYHGDETIVTLHTTTEKAVAYAVAEVKDCTGIENVPVKTSEQMLEYGWTLEGVEFVILDNDWDDMERVYTVTDQEVDPVYVNKFT